MFKAGRDIHPVIPVFLGRTTVNLLLKLCDLDKVRGIRCQTRTFNFRASRRTNKAEKRDRRGVKAPLFPVGPKVYFVITPQAMRSPAFPEGSVFMSSALAWMT